ncbi:MAG TPA: methylated-DNA--[protein]-cysteine S-methyltransferase [Bryobacteraceae bacterium]|nr:methylated-DNA--[protein]-cysteine S-methyltransferase [Bryobacteraceae bacterium]
MMQVRNLCRYIESHCGETLRLKDLAGRAGLSPFHFQRAFKATTGVTPKQYAEACRMRSLKANLRHAGSVTDAIYETGFGSGSRVYERADTRLGMTPRQYREGGRHASISYVIRRTPAGSMLLGATDRGICFLQFGDRKESLVEALREEYPNAAISVAKESPQLQEWLRRLNAYLAGDGQNLDLPLDVQATAFQMKVWEYLQRIPYGETESYGSVAAGMGMPKATRAVASACAANRVALVIPCHRVIRANGDLGGYRWGIDRKQTFLKAERESASGSLQ